MNRPMRNPAKTQRQKMRWYTARRYHNAQVALNCMDELRVIADYRRSQEAELLNGGES
jgi:hypothetical protein